MIWLGIFQNKSNVNIEIDATFDSYMVKMCTVLQKERFIKSLFILFIKVY